MKKKFTFRRLLQFRLRSILALMVLVAFAAGYFASVARSYERERQALATIEQMDVPAQPSTWSAASKPAASKPVGPGQAVTPAQPSDWTTNVATNAAALPAVPLVAF